MGVAARGSPGKCLRGVLDETDLKTIRNLDFASHSKIQIGCGSGYCFYKILISFVFMGGGALSIRLVKS